MFQIDDDMTIYITRGDVAYFTVTADNNGVPYIFQPGDVVRIKVFAKKDATNVAFQKDFAVLEESEKVDILLTEQETKIGDVISKPVDYWYEIELNPYTNPQTIVGYDDDGAKIFKLFPEGRDLGPEITPEDVPVVDAELSLTSERPVQNQAVTRAMVRLSDEVKSELADVTETTNTAFVKASGVETDLVITNARITNLARLSEGSTTGDAELIDIRTGANGTVYANAGESVRGQISDLKSDLSELDVLMTDVFDKNILLKNTGYIGSNGIVNASTSAKYTDYEDISNYDTLTYFTRISEGALELAFYDANKNLLSDISVLGSEANRVRTVDLTDTKYSNAKYVILSCYGESNFTKFYCIASKNNLDNRVSYLENNAVTDDEIITYVPENGNQFNKDTVKVGYEVYNDGKFVVEPNSAISDYIYVKGHSTIYLNNLPIFDGFGCYYSFYDENKNAILSGKTLAKESSKQVVTIPPDACYFAFSLYQRWTSGSKDYDNVMVSFSGYKEYEPFIECIREINGLQIPKIETAVSTKDKKMIIFGDSITETATISDDGSTYTEGRRTNWMTFASGYLHTNNFKNYAKSGATYKDGSNILVRQQVSDQINMAMADSNNDDAEIVIISLGTNDGASSLGTYETAMSKTSLDELDRTKLYEAIRWAMWTLRTKYEDATFFVALPIQRASGEQPVALLNAITEMAHRYNFIIIDAHNESGIVRDFEVSGAQGRFLEDGLHPNAEGSDKMAKLYANVILRNFIAN